MKCVFSNVGVLTALPHLDYRHFRLIEYRREGNIADREDPQWMTLHFLNLVLGVLMVFLVIDCVSSSDMSQKQEGKSKTYLVYSSIYALDGSIGGRRK